MAKRYGTGIGLLTLWRGIFMKTLLVAFTLLTSIFSSASHSSILTLESCNVAYYRADLNFVSRVPEEIVEDILRSKGYTFDPSSDRDKSD